MGAAQRTYMLIVICWTGYEKTALHSNCLDTAITLNRRNTGLLVSAEYTVEWLRRYNF